jgi:hypothetical protein
LGAARSSAASALTEKVALLDKIAVDMGWNPQQLAEAKAQVTGALKAGSGTPADLQRYDRMTSLPWYKALNDDQKAIYDKEFFGVAASSTTTPVRLQEYQAMKDQPWYKNATPAEKAQHDKKFFKVDEDSVATPAEIQKYREMKLRPFYTNASDEEKAEIDARFFSVEDPDAMVARREKEVADKGNRKAFVALLREQGKLPPGIIDNFALAKTAAAMDIMYDNLSDEDKGNMPADVRTWAAIKDGFPANTPADEIEKYRKIHFGLEDRESLTPNQKEMAAFVAINTDPTKTPEERIRAGYMYGVYSGPETARRYFEEWDANNIGATDEDRDEQRALLGLPTGVEAEHAQVKLELDQIRLADAKKVEAAIEAGNSAVQVMAIPGTTSHKFVKMPDQDYWTMINIGTGKAADAPVSEEQAIKWNKWLEGAGISYRWHPDNTPAGWSYGSMGGFSTSRELFGGGTEQGGSEGNKAFIPESQFPENIPRNIPIGRQFKVGGKIYIRVKGGANLVK